MKKIISIILMIAMLMSTFVFAEEIQQENIDTVASTISKINVVISDNVDANAKSRNEYSDRYTKIYLPQEETVTLAVSFDINMDGYKAVYKDGETYNDFGSITSAAIESGQSYADKRFEVYIESTTDQSRARVGELVVYSWLNYPPLYMV